MTKALLLFVCCLFAGLAVGEEDSHLVTMDRGPRTLSGVVTFADQDGVFFFFRTPEGESWRGALQDVKQQPQVGDRVSVSGQILPQTVNRRIDRCELTVLGHDAGFRPEPEIVSVSQLNEHPVAGSTEPDRFARVVSVSGRVTDVNRRMDSVQLIMSDGQKSLSVTFHLPADRPMLEGLAIGALVRVTGGYSYVTLPTSEHVPYFTGITQPTVMLLSADDLEVLTKPPFWTPVRVWMAVGFAGFVGLGLLLWGVSLRRTVARQVKVIESALRERAVADGVRRERLRLSHDLHDDFQQLLAGTMFRISAAQNWLEEHDEAKVREQLEKATVNLVHTQSQLRTVLWGLQEESEGPGSLTDLFRYAAGRMAHWEGVVKIASTGKEPPLARTMAGGLLMILQEAVGNAIRHGQAQRVDVLVDFRPGSLVLSVADDGCGFDCAAHGRGLGLGSMEDRARTLGGTFAVTSEPGRGTVVKVEVPV